MGKSQNEHKFTNIINHNHYREIYPCGEWELEARRTLLCFHSPFSFCHTKPWEMCMLFKDYFHYLPQNTAHSQRSHYFLSLFYQSSKWLPHSSTRSPFERGTGEHESFQIGLQLCLMISDTLQNFFQPYLPGFL